MEHAGTMRAVAVRRLIAGRRLQLDVYHRSGQVLMRRGELLRELDIELLLQHDITEVYITRDAQALAQFQRGCSHAELKVADLEEGVTVTHDVIARDGTILARAGSTVSARMKRQLIGHGVESFFRPRPREERGLDEFEAFLAARPLIEAPPPETAAGPQAQAPEVEDGDEVAALASAEKTVLPGAGPLLKQMRQAYRLESRPPAEIRDQERRYRGTTGMAGKIFQALGGGEKLSDQHIAVVTEQVVNAIARDYTLLLNVAKTKHPAKYQLYHSINTAIYACNIAAFMGFSTRRVYEVAYAAFLMDAGMLRVPQAILRKPGALTAEERAEVERHTLYSAQLIAGIRGIPQSCRLVAQEHHERLDGSGYPRGRRDKDLHDLTRICMVADLFDAKTTPRPHRKAFPPHGAMELLIRLVAAKRLDARVVKTFLGLNSLFPIGTCVRLSDGSAGCVTAANQTHFARPVVAVLFEKGERIPETRYVDLALREDLEIAAVADARELGLAPFEGF